MLKTIHYDELLTIKKDLDGMLSKHVEWLTLLQKSIICDLPSLKKLLSHHTTCDFGKWYYSVTLQAVIESPDFIHLGVTHKNLHKIANCILEQYERNHIVEENDFDLFIESEKAFFDTFNHFNENILATESQFDHLTNIPNRSLVTLILEKEYSKILRNGGECCIAFADIDGFKNINDSYGHAIGDKVLREISNYFSKSIRPFDTVGRYGGEEFIFCFPQTSLHNAKIVLERMRCGVEALSISTDGSNTIRITSSFGLSKMSVDEPLNELIKQADNAMYQAKNDGRNKVKAWIPTS